MSKKDFHKKEFDSATLKKLDIYREYFNECFPVFLYGGWSNVMIYDFFAGEGTDSKGHYGSPLIALESISNYCKDITERKINVIIRFNEKKVKKYKKLKLNKDKFLENCNKTEKCPNTDNGCIIDKNIIIENKDFASYFNKIYPQMQSQTNPRIIFLDQSGFKFITREVFLKFIDLPSTDFMFFVASSYLRRFRKIDFFNKYLEMEKLDFDTTKPFHCHRILANYYEQLIPENKEYYTAHFSIKKGKNYYGLIFGTNHILGIEKFLKICWKHDNITGEANYDIDREPSYSGNTLFTELNESRKIQVFKNELRNKIISKEITSNIYVYSYAFMNKCLPKHANEVLTSLVKEGILKEAKTSNEKIHKLKEAPLIFKNQ